MMWLGGAKAYDLVAMEMIMGAGQLALSDSSDMGRDAGSHHGALKYKWQQGISCWLKFTTASMQELTYTTELRKIPSFCRNDMRTYTHHATVGFLPAHDSNMVFSLVTQVAMATPKSSSFVIEIAGGKSTYLQTDNQTRINTMSSCMVT